MPAKYEYRIYDYGVPIWIGKYRNLRNLPHWHLEHEIIVCRDGQATVTVDGQHLTLGPGSCVFCCGGSVHYIDADPNCLLTIALFDPEFVKSFADKQILKNPLYPDRYHTGARLLEIENEIAKQSSFYVEKSKTLLINLLIDIFRGEELAPGRVQNIFGIGAVFVPVEVLDEWEHGVLHDGVRLGGGKVAEHAPLEQLAVNGALTDPHLTSKNALIRQTQHGSFLYPEVVGFVEIVDEHQIGDLLDHVQRVNKAARRENVPKTVNFIFQLTGNHFIFLLCALFGQQSMNIYVFIILCFVRERNGA